MDWTDWLRAIAALGVTLALIAGAGLLARRMGMLQAPVPGGKRRMGVVESLFLDPRRRVVIVRVDDQDHVLLLSPFGDHPITSKPAVIVEPPAAPAPEQSS
jgi:flagellar protein FliO/FliZ